MIPVKNFTKDRSEYLKEGEEREGEEVRERVGKRAKSHKVCIIAYSL